jgi:hypothetical protein
MARLSALERIQAGGTVAWGELITRPRQPSPQRNCTKKEESSKGNGQLGKEIVTGWAPKVKPSGTERANLLPSSSVVFNNHIGNPGSFD